MRNLKKIINSNRIQTEKNYKNGENLFYIAYLLFLLSTIVFDYSEIQYFPQAYLIKKIIKFTMYTLLSFKIIFYSRYTIREILLLIIVIPCFFISYICSKRYNLFIGMILIIASKNVDLQKIIKFDIKYRILIVSLIIILCLIGIIENYILIRYENMQLRYGMGFIHPNTLAGLIMVICLEWIYIRYNNIKIYDYLGIIVIMFIVYKITDSRSSIIVIIMALILTIYFKKYHKKFEKRNIMKLLFSSIIFFLMLGSVILCINYNIHNEFMLNLNKLFSGRINQGNIFINNYGFSIIGQSVETVSYRAALNKNIKAAILDNAYINMGIIYGIIPLFLFLLSYSLLIKKAIKERIYPILVMLITFALYGVMETYLFNIIYNLFLIFISYVLYKDSYKKI